MHSGMLIGYGAAALAAMLTLPSDDRLAHAQAADASDVQVSDLKLDSDESARSLLELEAAELRANEEFSRSVPAGTSVYEAKDKGYAAARAADITYDEESEAFFRTAIAWFRWAALQGDGSAAEELAHKYREFARHHTVRSEIWWPHIELNENLGKAYRALSCEWYRRAADAGNQAALGYTNWGGCHRE